jgi:hypothetical protein
MFQKLYFRFCTNVPIAVIRKFRLMFSKLVSSNNVYWLCYIVHVTLIRSSSPPLYIFFKVHICENNIRTFIGHQLNNSFSTVACSSLHPLLSGFFSYNYYLFRHRENNAVLKKKLIGCLPAFLWRVVYCYSVWIMPWS